MAAAATDNQANFAWTSESNQNDLSAQADELSSAMSELEFRAELLSSLEVNTADFQAEAANCEGAKAAIKNSFSAAKAAIDLAIAVPVVGLALTHTKNAFDQVEMIMQDGLKVADAASMITIKLSFTALKGILSSLALGNLKSVVVPVLDTLNSIESSIIDLSKCAMGTTKIVIDQSHCSSLADLYRQVIAESIKINPALSLPTDASEDLKRLAAGSLSVLDLMDKSSIATTNDGLLASRPIFASDVLDQYRSELLRVATTDDIKDYAISALGTSIGVSNALESCLRVAADPIGAVDELNDELEAQAYYDDDEDEDDEDEDDDEDEVEEVNAAEVQSEKTEEVVNQPVAAA
ncbi:hypothetical protein BGX27_004990 [Mortierella sp. AM989]|nr:hypothetical protein BGX27_004990 [Mortierella sp. AM989]